MKVRRIGLRSMNFVSLTFDGVNSEGLPMFSIEFEIVGMDPKEDALIHEVLHEVLEEDWRVKYYGDL